MIKPSIGSIVEVKDIANISTIDKNHIRIKDIGKITAIIFYKGVSL